TVLNLRRRVRAWFGVHRQSVVIAGGLLTLVAVVHGWGVAGAPAVTDDEGTYMAQAWAVQVQHHLAPYTYWYDHPPLAWLQIAGWTWMTGAFHGSVHAIAAGRELMVVASVVSAGLLYLLARRVHLRRGCAGLAVGLFALSPLAVDYQRLVLLDNVAVPWLLAALVLAASPRRSLWATAASGGCFAAAVLSKETFLLALPAVITLLWLRSDPRTRAFCVTGFTATFGLLVVAYPLYAVLKGELIPGAGHVSLLQAVKFQLISRQGSGSVFSSGSNAHGTVAVWLGLDHWLLALGLVALPVGVALRRHRWMAVGFGLPILLAIRGGYLPDPFVIALLPFAALLVAAAVDATWGLLVVRRDPHRRATVYLGSQVVAAVTAVVLVAALVPPWVSGDHSLATGNATAPVWNAERWIEGNVNRNQRLIVDDSMWTDLVEHGFNPNLGVVWFYKLDTTNNLDPSVARALPDGWKDFGYVVSTPIIRSALRQLPGGLVPVRQALAASTSVATFGTGAGQIDVRRIHKP
ncbi:MAG: ArnT family glycosyltransferase, partial [Pseudonocardiaceae bacterium]